MKLTKAKLQQWGTCSDCGAERLPPYMRCEKCHARWQEKALIMAHSKPDHWTLPDEVEEKPRPGYGWFKFDWILGWAQPFVEWHDRVTRINSEAQKLGITNAQIVEYTRKQLETLADKPRNGFQKRMAWAVGFLLSKINRYWYEGPL